MVTSSDGKLLVGYPPHVAEELQAAGRPAQPESVPWAEYQAAGLEKQHPLLADALRAFAGVVQEHAGRQQEREEQQEQQAEAQGGKQAGGQGAAPAGRRALRQQQQQQQVVVQQDGGGAQEEEGEGEEGAPRGGPMLFVELKGKAMGVQAAQQLAEAARQLGIEQRVGLWFARSAAAPPDTADVYAWLTTAGAGLQRVLSFPDQE